MKESRIVKIALPIDIFNNIVKNDDGIKSVMLIPIITAIENERQKVINLFILSFLILKKITIPPSRVDIPAIVDIKNAFNIDT